MKPTSAGDAVPDTPAMTAESMTNDDFDSFPHVRQRSSHPDGSSDATLWQSGLGSALSNTRSTAAVNSTRSDNPGWIQVDNSAFNDRFCNKARATRRAG